MMDICIISLIIGVFSSITVCAQPLPPPLNPEDFLATGYSRAMINLVGNEGRTSQKDSLFDLYILPNPFVGEPVQDLDFWYHHLQAFQFRPEAGAFLYTDPLMDPAPPTLCTNTAKPEASRLDQVDPNRYLSPIQAARLHRFAARTPDGSISSETICSLLDLLTRWDPGSATASLLLSIHEASACPTEELQTWADRIMFFDGQGDTTRSVQLTTHPAEQRDWMYQEELDVFPFLYDESVDFYGKVLQNCISRGRPAWTALYDLVQTHHPRTLYYLAANAYRQDVLQTIAPPIHFMDVLGALSGMDIQKEDLGGWVSHFFAHADQWIWNDQRQQFDYYPEIKDHQLLVESWFRYLASPDPKVANTFYHQIINADPAIVAQYSGTYRRILTQWNPILPPPNLPFPEITAHFRKDAREEDHALTLPPGIAGLVEQFLLPLPLSERIALEDSLIRRCTVDDLTALEAQALEWVAFPSAERSLSRIIDHLYRRYGPTDQPGTFLRKAGLFLDPERGDAASRYMTMLRGWVDLTTAEDWFRNSDDAASRAAVQELLPLSRLEGFMRQPDRTLPSDMTRLPAPDLISEDDWKTAITRSKSPDALLRFIQYFQIHPREWQSGLLLSLCPSNPSNPEEEAVQEAMIRLMEYVSGLYHQDEDLDWWQEHWRRGNETWSGMTRSIGEEFVLSWQRSGELAPDRLAFLLRRHKSLLANGPHWQDLAVHWEQPDRVLTLPLDSLSVSTDLPFLLDLGLSADRVAGMFAAFDLTNAGQLDLFFRTLLDHAMAEGSLPDVVNRLFNQEPYRAWLTLPAQEDWRQSIGLTIQSWLTESLWISAYEEANALAQWIWCRSSGFPDQWINLLLEDDRDPGLQQQILGLLCSDLDMDGMHGLLTQLEQVEAPLRGPLGAQVLLAFGLPDLDWEEASSYRRALLELSDTSLERILSEALMSLSPAFAPPSDHGSAAEWMANLVQAEYVRPLFGYRSNPRSFPVTTALVWWICRFQGQSSAIEALKRYRRNDDLNELVKAANLPDAVTNRTGINSLFDPD